MLVFRSGYYSGNGFKGTKAPNQSDLKAFATKYENRNPFTEFEGSERKRRMNNLNPAERYTYQSISLLMRYRSGRIFIVVYTVLLHILVFTILYIHAMEDVK